MTKTKKLSKGLALVLAVVLALTPMAGFPITALATGEAATPQANTPAADADANTDAAPGAAPSTPAPEAETPQAEAPATDAGTNPDTAGSATKFPAANAVTPDPAATPAPLAATPTVDPAAAGDVPISAENFPDGIFREYVRQEFDKNGNQTLEADEIKAATYLNISEYGIATLQGIKYLTALTSLDCRYNNLTDLDVSHNTALTGLWCGHNELITDLDVSHNTALTILDCHNTALTDLNVSHNTALTILDCGDTRLTNLDVSQNTALTDLDCSGNWDCSYNRLTDLDVSNNTALTYLNCSNNRLTDLDVSKNTALTDLHCDNNQLTTLDLTGLNKLGEDSWRRSFSPQAPQIPVVKRGTLYELDIEALAKGQTLTAITLDGAAVDLATYEKMRDTNPKDLQYTCATSAVGKSGQTMEVKAAGFDLYYLATLSPDANGSISSDVAPSASGEILLAEKSEPTFTVTPASGYQVATLTVNGKDAKGNLVGETLTLPAVTDTVAIAVTFEKIPAPPTPPVDPPKPPVDPIDPVDPPKPPVDPVDPPKPPVNPADPVVPIDPPKPPVNPTDPVDPPKPPVDPADPITPPTPPVVSDNGGNGNNNGGGTTIVERTNTVVVPAAPQAAAPETPATPDAPAAAAAKTEAPTKATADTATPQGQLENPTLGAQALDSQHSHLPLALLLLAIWLVGGFAVIRQRKHTHDAIDGATY
ncbi:MAG: hypothetical protein RR381_03040 [Raoultibacter sp.]